MIFGKLTFEERKALEELYEKYRGDILKVSNYELKDEHLAEDMLQNMMLKLVRLFDERGDLCKGLNKTYILSMARNGSRDMRRKTKKEKLVDMASPETRDLYTEQDGADPIGSWELSEELLRVLNRLSERDKEIIYLKFRKGYTFVEISKFYNKNSNYAAMRFSLIKKEIAKALEEEGYER